jgi:hypothetical protein
MGIPKYGANFAITADFLKTVSYFLSLVRPGSAVSVNIEGGGYLTLTLSRLTFLR